MTKIINWQDVSIAEKNAILTRPSSIIAAKINEQTKAILQKVKLDGDAILFDLAKKYDGAILRQLKVSADEFELARNKISADAKKAIEFAKKQIEKNHQSQYLSSQSITVCEGVVCERQARAIERVGLYIPGGLAPLVSTVLMLAVPAQLANSTLRIICTPPNAQGVIDAHILFAAELCGITDVYKVGGAQAIGAMAYGTQTIPKVDKIFGPGNAWVTQAKLVVSQDADGASIDLPAGPSEVMVIADQYAKPSYIAADLLSQAEHGVDSQVILVTTSMKLAQAVKTALQEQVVNLPRAAIAKQALAHSYILLVNNIEEAIAISNDYAPEHLILQLADFEKYTKQIRHAGAVFLGEYSPEVVGDYVTGSNHVLPTSGYAKSYSGLSVSDFMKFIHFQTVTRQGLRIIGPYAEKLAQIEGLEAHRKAVAIRLAEEAMYVK